MCETPTMSLRQAPSTCCSSALPSRLFTPATRAVPLYVLHTNLTGTMHCLEAARRFKAGRGLPLDEPGVSDRDVASSPPRARGSRLDIAEGASGQGWSTRGVSTDFALTGFRSMYGATKLASELLLEEYRAMYGLRTVVNRCGVIAGPWQMGKVDQGFVALWASRHLYGGHLTYTGFGGEGFQIRDVLHVADLYDLIRLQLEDLARHSGSVYNVGGGRGNAISLAELTESCRARVDASIPIDRDPHTSAADIPYYVTDNTAVTSATGWAPARSLDTLLDDVFAWMRKHRSTLEPIFNASSPSAAVPAR